VIVCSDSSREEDFSVNSGCEDSMEWRFPCSRSTEDLERDGGRERGREGGREGRRKGVREGGSEGGNEGEREGVRKGSGKRDVYS